MAELARARHKRDNALEEARGECERLNDSAERDAALAGLDAERGERVVIEGERII